MRKYFETYDAANIRANEAQNKPSFKRLGYKCKPTMDTNNKWYVSIVVHGVIIGELWK